MAFWHGDRVTVAVRWRQGNGGRLKSAHQPCREHAILRGVNSHLKGSRAINAAVSLHHAPCHQLPCPLILHHAPAHMSGLRKSCALLGCGDPVHAPCMSRTPPHGTPPTLSPVHFEPCTTQARTVVRLLSGACHQSQGHHTQGQWHHTQGKEHHG